jgi:quercetin dioxygenase-like cupin family protein
VTAIGSPSPITLGPDEGEVLWFLDFLTTVKASGEETDGGLTVMEQIAPFGAGSPLHVHRREDEWFYVLEGELTIWVDGEVSVAGPGSFACGPRDVPHTFVVSGLTGARWLLGAAPAGFDDFVRAVAAPALSRALPPADLPRPTPEQLTELAADYGIEILGPPGIPS